MRKRISLMIIFVMLFMAALPLTARAAGYRLDKVLILSRHGLRTPTANNAKTLSSITPHKWFDWTAAPGALSMKGEVLETMMGQYFRKWLESEGFMPVNYEPAIGEMRFFSNSFQRTIDTTHQFVSGMLPTANIRVEKRFALDEADPVFFPGVGEISDEFRAKAMTEYNALGGIKTLGGRLEKEITLIADIIGFKDSEYAKANGLYTFNTDDLEYELDTLAISGNFRLAMRASDALTLQYYEDESPAGASFGHRLSEEEWRGVARVKDMGINALFKMPTLSKRLAHPLLELMQRELSMKDRRFTFICGHDINLATVITSLGAMPYTLPLSIEEKTPIGAKLVIEKWVNDDGEELAAVKLIYQSAEQMRRRLPLTLENPPQIYSLSLSRLETNEDGLYSFDALCERFASAAANN